MKDKIKATVVNMYLKGDAKEDFDNVRKAIEENKSSDIIVFSEVCISNLKDSKQRDDMISSLKELSAKEDIIIVIGIDEVVGGKKYNSGYLFEDGRSNVYHKVHLVFEEVSDYEPGSSFPVFDTKIGRIGIMICYDAIFPESARCLRLNGAEIICLLAQWVKDEDDYWDKVTSVRAKENWVYLIASDDINKGCGKSRIIGPDGKIIVSTIKKKPYHCATAVLEGNVIKKLNSADPSSNWTKRRQPGAYTALSK